MEKSTGLFKRHVIGFFTGIGLFILALIISPIVSYQIGKLEGRYDFRHGKRQLMWCGGGGDENHELSREIRKVLLSEFSVKVVLPSSCSLDMINAQRIHGYNDQQSKELEMIYGRNVIEETETKLMLCDMVRYHTEHALTELDH